MNEPTASLNLRKFPAERRDIAKRRAGAHGITVGEYVCGLMDVHEALIERAQAGDSAAMAILVAAGLEPRTQ